VAVWLMDDIFIRQGSKGGEGDVKCVAILPCCKSWQQKAGTGIITWEDPERVKTYIDWRVTVYMGNTEITHCPFCGHEFLCVPMWNSSLVCGTIRGAVQQLRSNLF
jgi:hypothetical protein